MSVLEHALAYYDACLNIIPLHSVTGGVCSCGSLSCGKPGKHPRVRWRTLKSSPMSRSQVEEFWTRYPDSNIGVITGAVSGVAVLDIDGPEGVASLEGAGVPLTDLPATPTVETGGGGLHYYFRMPEDPKLVKTVAGVLSKVDIRAEGGLAVLPPSIHSSGKPYVWQEGRDLELDFADFDFDLLNSSGKTEKIGDQRERWYERILAGVSHGGRNEAAARLAGRYFALGMTEAEVFLLLRSWNENNDPPMDVRELKVVVRSIYEAEVDDRSRERKLEDISDHLKVKLDNVKMISGDSPKIVLEFETGTATMTASQLLSPKSFQQAVAEATKTVVRKLGARTVPTHDRFAQMVLDVAEEVDAGDEATASGEMMLMVQNLLQNETIISEAVSPVPLKGAFAFDGHVWISAVDLVQRAQISFGMRISLAQAAQGMRGIGMQPRSFSTIGGGNRNTWGIELQRVPFVQIRKLDHAVD